MALTKISTAMWNSVPHHLSHDFNVDDVLFVDVSDNKVGIGTTSPTAKLEINPSSGDADLILSSNGTQTLRLDQNSIRTTTTNDLTLFTNGNSNQLVLDSGGNIGIGTNSPSQKLDVVGRTLLRDKVFITGGNYSESDLYILNTNNVNTGVGYAAKVIGVNIKDAVGSANEVYLRSNTGGLTSAGAIYLSSDSTAPNQGIFGVLGGTGAANTQLTHFFTINDQGKVGIGTTSPNLPLEVSSNAASAEILRLRYNAGYYTDYGSNNLNFTGSSQTYSIKNNGNTAIYINSISNIGIGTTNPAAKLQVSDTSNALQMRIGDLYAGLSPYVRWQGKNAANTTNRYADIELDAENGIFTLRAPNTSTPTIDALNIIQGGNVGIGTISPTYKLDISGASALVSRLYSTGYTNLDIESTRTSGNIGGIRWETAGDAYKTAEINGIVNGGLDFKVGTGSTSIATRMSINSSGNVIATVDMRAPVFYDSDNTSYYLNPSDGSTNPVLRFYSSRILSRYVSTWSGNEDHDILYSGYATALGDYVYLKAAGNSSSSLGSIVITDGAGFYFGRSASRTGGVDNSASNPISTVLFRVDNSGNTYAKLLYDSDNTGYYLNPASSSYLNAVTATRIGVNPSGSSTTKYGISLYGGYSSGEPTYGLLFTGTPGLGTHGAVTSDWATYFTMNDSTTRGWIFRRVGAANVASISGGGTAHFNGDVVAYSSSDERLKDNKKNIDNALEKVESLNGIEFDWNDNQTIYSGHDIGVIAQEVEKVLPEIVADREDGYKAVKYEKLVPLLIEAVKELSEKVKMLENK